MCDPGKRVFRAKGCAGLGCVWESSEAGHLIKARLKGGRREEDLYCVSRGMGLNCPLEKEKLRG